MPNGGTEKVSRNRYTVVGCHIKMVLFISAFEPKTDTFRKMLKALVLRNYAIFEGSICHPPLNIGFETPEA